MGKKKTDFNITIQAIFMVEAYSEEEAGTMADEISDAMQDGVFKRAEVRGVKFASDEADFSCENVEEA